MEKKAETTVLLGVWGLGLSRNGEDKGNNFVFRVQSFGFSNLVRNGKGMNLSFGTGTLNLKF